MNRPPQSVYLNSFASLWDLLEALLRGHTLPLSGQDDSEKFMQQQMVIDLLTLQKL